MASLSLPRVLQLKKNSLDAEREQFEKFQTLAIQKAINSIETPVKEKHVRSTIIGTFQEQSAVTYWMVAVRLPLQDNRIVAWKFCHVTHKLLREGHPACLDDSQRHITMIENLGKLWVHLREGYGKLVHLYCNLLVCKLKFHARNPRFPGNMQLTADELDAIAENDVNNYFQLCVELFDYMDDILNLQEAVFDSLGNARANSMTASGQCRLAALIPCAQDASQIYDCNVRLLFRLHASLPADTLSGHRERFRQQFKKLSSFYKHASSLQYYRNLLTLPVLPSNPPNFLLQSDFGTYVTPVVSIPDPQPDEVDSVGSLIDTSDTISIATTPDHSEAFERRRTPSPQPDPVVERDRLIDHLQNELRRMRSEVTTRVEERNNIMGAMRELSMKLESQLHAVKAELEQERNKSEMLSAQTPEIKQKLAATEEKAKVTDEKFQKLKGAYTQLREEHINLIRQKAEVDKVTANLRAATAQHESAKVALQQQLNDRMKDVELLQQSASSSEEVEAYKSQVASLRVDLENSRQKEIELETLRASMEALEIEHNTAKTIQEEKLNTITSELKETKEILEQIKREKDERDIELSKVKEELIGLREKSGEEYNKVVSEKEAALRQVADLTQQYQQEKEEQLLATNKFRSELETLQRRLIDAETEFSHQSEAIKENMQSKNKALQNIVNTKDIEIKETVGKLEAVQAEMEMSKKDYEEKISQLNTEINNLSGKIHDLNQCNIDSENMSHKLAEEINNIQCEATKKIEALENNLKEKYDAIDRYEKLVTEIKTANKNVIEDIENNKTVEMSKLQNELCIKDEEKVALETKIIGINKDIEELMRSSKETIFKLENEKIEYGDKLKEKTVEVTILNEKLKNITECKDEIIENLKNIVAEKDSQVIALNVEVTKLSEKNMKLEEEFKEFQAELEIGRNEFLSIKEEHEQIVQRNETNLILKNQELRELSEKISELLHEKKELLLEKEKISNEFSTEKQVFESAIKEKDETIQKLRNEYQTGLNEKEQMKDNLISEFDNLKMVYDKYKIEKENEITSLCEKLENQNTCSDLKLKEVYTELEVKTESLKATLDDMQALKDKHKKEIEQTILEKDKEKQMLQAKFDVSDNKRLNAESELQDLLQQNTVLEADLATLKIQLEETKRELEKQSASIVRCAGEVATEVTVDATAELEGSRPSDRNAAQLAASALQELAALTQVKGNEEVVAKSAMLAAHNAAQLAASIAELANTATDLTLADKLNAECRSMLLATKDCMEGIKSGTLSPTRCAQASERIQTASKAAAAARAGCDPLSVDDELATMDRAIEDAAKQIESLLAASRAGDSGVKLEVNNKILDACTTLMAAVKVLVQESRTLQMELGDSVARQTMYRKNPQWSEGLISASKAVVFAAKLLVTSADEAVGSAGRLEGVSAAAHEVAGSTAQLVAASRARAPPASAALQRLGASSRAVAAATAAVVAAARHAAALRHDTEALDTSTLTLTATRRLEMESKVRALELETALDAERARLAALRKRHYHLAQVEENGNMTNGKE